LELCRLLAAKVSFFISNLLSMRGYFPIPMAQEGAPALMTNNAMVRTTINMRPLELCRLLAAKVSFFISNLLSMRGHFPMPMAQEGAPALMTNRAMVRTTINMRPLELCRLLAAKVSFFISNLLCVRGYLPMPMAQEGAPALMTNRAMVRTTINMRPLELCRLLAAKVSFFISNLLCIRLNF